MKWLLIVLLALTSSIVGCSKNNNTGYECYSCDGEVARAALVCPHCGQPFTNRSPRDLSMDKPFTDKSPRNLSMDKPKAAIIIPASEDWNQTINGKIAPNDTPMMLPGMIAPVTLTAEEARVTETDEVIGITVGAEHRAYLVHAFAPLGQKVINDLINEIPITVTYCDIHERARVFTSRERGEYLTVGLGGWRNKEMFFYFDNIRFGQSSKNAPLPDYPYIITTWGEWLEEHPNSRIYLGDGVIPDDNLSFDNDKPEISADP